MYRLVFWELGLMIMVIGMLASHALNVEAVHYEWKTSEPVRGISYYDHKGVFRSVAFTPCQEVQTRANPQSVPFQHLIRYEIEGKVITDVIDSQQGILFANCEPFIVPLP